MKHSVVMSCHEVVCGVSGRSYDDVMVALIQP